MKNEIHENRRTTHQENSLFVFDCLFVFVCFCFLFCSFLLFTGHLDEELGGPQHVSRVERFERDAVHSDTLRT